MIYSYASCIIGEFMWHDNLAVTPICPTSFYLGWTGTLYPKQIAERYNRIKGKRILLFCHQEENRNFWKVGSVGQIKLSFIKEQPQVQNLGAFSTIPLPKKSEQNWAFCQVYFLSILIFNYIIGSVAEDNTTFFFLGGGAL